MLGLTVGLYVLDVIVVGAYLLSTLGVLRHSDFDWANAVFGPFILAASLMTGGWQPVLVLTITFTIAGWIGVLKGNDHA